VETTGRRRRLAEFILSRPPLTTLCRVATPRRLRIIAAHGVEDGPAFRGQLENIQRNYNVVSQAEVLDWLSGAQPLPPRAVWLTFDDGDPSVVEVGLPQLISAGLSATMFICPGLIERNSLPWWDVMGDAIVAGWRPPGYSRVEDFKVIPDHLRRSLLAEATGFLAGRRATDGALSRAQLTRWTDAGNSLGNHTWDHPCLDQCDESIQEEQIVRADTWLRENVDGYMPVFAYPNGDWTVSSERVLEGLGYRGVCLFDHHVNTERPNPLRLSRIRLTAGASTARTEALLGGLHSVLLSRFASLKR
jgi:peptidoglycan/xylan/chitin deacetylase (PgdA/CDA1 family)